MKKAEQIELAKYINVYLFALNCPHDSEHIYNAIECFYSDYKEAMIVSAEE
jgi:hypothetical protein